MHATLHRYLCYTEMVHLFVTTLNGFVQNTSPFIVQHVVELKGLNSLRYSLAITNVCLGTVYEVDGLCIYVGFLRQAFKFDCSLKTWNRV